MKVVALFEDKIGMLEHRTNKANLHIEYLIKNNKEVLMAGGLRSEVNSHFEGGMWVMEVESFVQAEEIIKNDPYYISELRSYKLFAWE